MQKLRPDKSFQQEPDICLHFPHCLQLSNRFVFVFGPVPDDHPGWAGRQLAVAERERERETHTHRRRERGLGFRKKGKKERKKLKTLSPTSHTREEATWERLADWETTRGHKCMRGKVWKKAGKWRECYSLFTPHISTTVSLVESGADLHALTAHHGLCIDDGSVLLFYPSKLCIAATPKATTHTMMGCLVCQLSGKKKKRKKRKQNARLSTLLPLKNKQTNVRQKRGLVN